MTDDAEVPKVVRKKPIDVEFLLARLKKTSVPGLKAVLRPHSWRGWRYVRPNLRKGTDMWELKKAVTKVTCRACGAPEGAFCVTSGGHWATPPHRDRVDDLAILTKSHRKPKFIREGR